MSKRFITAGVSMLAAGALVLSAAPAANAAPALTSPAAAAATPTDATLDERAAGLTALLDEISSIPDEVLLAGDAATTAWIAENADAPGGDTAVARANVLGCTGAIAAALAGVAFPAAKLLKVKKLADELGGVKKAVDLLWGASFNYEKVQAAGGALAALAAELVGITSIKEQCFS